MKHFLLLLFEIEKKKENFYIITKTNSIKIYLENKIKGFILINKRNVQLKSSLIYNFNKIFEKSFNFLRFKEYFSKIN